MKLTGLGQYGKGLVPCNPVLGQEICDQIERLKWSLWHGQVDKALRKLNDLEGIVKLSQKIAHLCSKERTIEGFGLARAPVFSLFPSPQLSSRGRRLGQTPPRHPFHQWSLKRTG